MEAMKILTADKVRTELRDLFRVESKSMSLAKVRDDFYSRYQGIISDLRRECDEMLANNDIRQYVLLKEQLTNAEMDFRAFFERRFGKIASMSPYTLSQEMLMRMTQEEKAAYTEYRSVTEKYSRMLTEGKI